MCGILTILGLDSERSDASELRRQALTLARKIRHRGPDWSGIYSDAHAILAHERLSIVDVEHGAQPLIDARTGAVLAVNGEIYNHKDLRAGLLTPHDFQTLSDCEVILYLYDEQSPREFLNRMNGIFGFVLYDPRRQTYLIARDPIGVIPLYVGWDRQEHLYVASEMKALVGHCERIREFPPGHFYLGHEADKGFQRYYEPSWAEPERVPPVIQAAMTNTSLMFLGFQLDDWAFRIFFRSIMDLQGSGRRSNYAHIAVQVDPDELRNRDPRRARQYVEEYFQDDSISIYWGQSDDFLREVAAQREAASKEH